MVDDRRAVSDDFAFDADYHAETSVALQRRLERSQLVLEDVHIDEEHQILDISRSSATGSVLVIPNRRKLKRRSRATS